ncbi:nucleotidyltransferase domain-containing protein [Clostridium sp. UBA4395]|uniref:nucleotidyltransferase domain-containing protein n=1 Tax=Clostridium sp. UBA4395 TaxID=1946360 RepID=UPI003216D599
MNLDGEIVDSIIAISKKYKCINKVVLFGSRARGDNELKSDIDLAVYADYDIFEFIEEIENTSPTLLEFDFSNMRRIDDEIFIEQVEKEGVTLYEKYRV